MRISRGRALRAAALAAAVMAMVVAAMVAIALQVRWLPYHPSDTRYPVRGLDVSHHQGVINWSDVATGDASFVFIKATEGGDWIDPQFSNNWRGAQAAGVARGAYHFFTFCRSGVEQAANFIAAVPNDPDMLPPAVDLEFGGNCAGGSSRLNIEQELDAFLDAVEARYGRAAILYATDEFFKAHLVGGGRDNQLWLRSLIVEPRYSDRDWTFWQYSGFGRSPGIDGPVDWNAFAGTEATFARWLGPARPASTE